VSVARFAQVDRGVPRRFSACKSDRFFDAQMLTYLSDKGVDVLLDGTVLEEATSWDVDAGTVTRHRRHADGSLVLQEGAPTFETLKGEVEVRWQKAPVA
jgi:hypothetical protein